MGLSIDYTCPRCATTKEQNLNDFSPGHRRTCPACQTPTELTHESLRSLAAQLEEGRRL